MRTSQLYCFVEAAQRNSITYAANDRGVSLQAVSRQISELEDELGVALFERHGSGVYLTQEGKIFLKRAKKALAAFEACSAPFWTDENLPHIDVALCVPAFYQDEAVLDNISQYISERIGTVAAIRLVEDPDDALSKLKKEECQLVVTVGAPRGWKGVKTSIICNAPVAASIMADNELAKKETVTLSELEDAGLYLRKGYYYFTDSIRRKLKEKGVSFQRLDLGLKDFYATLAKDGGCTLFPSLPGWDVLAPNSVTVPVDPSEGLTIEICLVQSKKAINSTILAKVDEAAKVLSA